MKENEIIIQVLITSEDISKKRGSYIWTINGFNEFETIVNQLHYGRNEAIYVHIPGYHFWQTLLAQRLGS